MMELKYYKLRSKLDEDIESSAVVDDDLVFVEDTKEIYTHGIFLAGDSYSIFNYNNIVAQSGEYVYGTSTHNLFIQYVSSGGKTYLIPAVYNTVRNTVKVYTGIITELDSDNNLGITIIKITYSMTSRSYTAEEKHVLYNMLTDDQKTVLDNISMEGRTYITGGEEVEYSDSSITVPSQRFSDGSNSIPEDNLFLDSATHSRAGLMSAADKTKLDELSNKLSDYDVIKTKALFGDKFVVHVDGILNYNEIRSQVLSEKAPSDHVTVNGLYIVNNYFGDNRPTLMLKVNDNYYTSWDATTYNSIPIAASSVKVNNNYVVIDESGNASYNTLYVQRHYASQDITAMYHLNSTGVMVSASEALNDYVYENALLN